MPKKKTYEELKARIRELESRLNGSANRDYKSRLFSFIFGRDENRQWALSLYNAIHGTSHQDISAITINTIEDVVCMGMKNDLSFLVSETVSLYRSMELYEQQSTFNPNMPVREFMYAARLYDKFIHSSRLNRYGKKLLPLPIPKLVVFYNGTDEKEDETVLSLSDAFREEIRQNILLRYSENRKNADKEISGSKNTCFEHSGCENSDKAEPDDAQLSAETERILREACPDIEVKVRMININRGHSPDILCACRPLEEYAWFVAQVRNSMASCTGPDNNTQADIGSAIDRAIDEMPDDFVIKKFITANRAEVKDMCLTEYNEAETMELLKEEGRQEGTHETRLLDIKNLMDCMQWTAEKAMDVLKIPQNQRAALYTGLSKN